MNSIVQLNLMVVVLILMLDNTQLFGQQQLPALTYWTLGLLPGQQTGDGSLYITIRKDPSYLLGFSVSPEFKIVAGVNTPNLLLLEAVQMFFGGIGSITSHNSTYSYTVRNKKDLRIIHNHFINYPLQK